MYSMSKRKREDSAELAKSMPSTGEISVKPKNKRGRPSKFSIARKTAANLIERARFANMFNNKKDPVDVAADMDADSIEAEITLVDDTIDRLEAGDDSDDSEDEVVYGAHGGATSTGGGIEAEDEAVVGSEAVSAERYRFTSTPFITVVSVHTALHYHYIGYMNSLSL